MKLMQVLVGIFGILWSSHGVMAQVHNGPMPVAFHEFEIFGEDSIYISHRPEFASIHAFQVIAEITLDPESKKKFLEHRRTADGTLIHYTLSPYRNVPVTKDRAKDQDDFVLPDTILAGSTFSGDIHSTESTVDRTLVHNAKVEIKAVIEKRMFDPYSPRPDTLSYLLFGHDGDSYVAHYLSAPSNPGEKTPDFDQILSIIVDGATFTKFTGRVYSLPNKPNTEGSLLKKGEVATLVDKNGQKVNVTVKAVVHEETLETMR